MRGASLDDDGGCSHCKGSTRGALQWVRMERLPESEAKAKTPVPAIRHRGFVLAHARAALLSAARYEMLLLKTLFGPAAPSDAPPPPLPLTRLFVTM